MDLHRQSVNIFWKDHTYIRSRLLWVVVLTLLWSGCDQKPDSIEGQVWYPVKIESSDYPVPYGTYALEFGSDSILTIYTLGTSHKTSSTYNRIGNKIILGKKEGSLALTYTLLNERLIINFDTLSTVHYVNSLPEKQIDLTKKLDQVLITKSWKFDSDLVEFHPSLNNELIKFELRRELRDATYHFKNDSFYNQHSEFAWGSNHFNGNNILVFSHLMNDIENQYFIIDFVTDTLISGYKFDRAGQRQPIQFSALVNKNLTPSIVGHWKMTSAEEIPRKFNDLIDDFGEAVGIRESDLENKALSLDFSSDSSFQFKVSSKVIAKGKWHADRSGSIVYLKAINEEDGALSTTTTYISLISSSPGEIVVHKTEDITEDDHEFEVKEYIQTYTKVVKDK